jgi:hypothetical protein
MVSNRTATRPPRFRGAPLPLRVAVVGAAVALCTGAGLVAYFVSGLSLPIGIGLAFVVSATVGVIVWRRLDAGQRTSARQRAWAGLRAGLVATVAYDVTRFAVVAIFHLHVKPYAAIPLFGQLLINVPADTGAALVVGLFYHVTNGACFAIAYTMLAGTRGVLAGIGFALVLEAFMLTFYPGWLNVQAIGEFFSMTILGHVAYGATLGGLSRRLLSGPRTVSGPASEVKSK